MTQLVESIEEIKEIMKLMIERCRYEIILIAPDFKDFPLKEIKANAKRLKITIASRILADSRKEVGDLASNKVDIRQRPEMNLYMAINGKLEVLFAPISSRNPVGIISDDPAWINLLYGYGMSLVEKCTKITLV